MRRPVLRVDTSRDTDAPLEVVLAGLANSRTWEAWSHVPHSAVRGRLGRPDGGMRLEYACRGWLGLQHQGSFEVGPRSGRVVLEHRGSVKGWAILLSIGWLRWRIERMWPRFVAGLPPGNSIQKNDENSSQ